MTKTVRAVLGAMALMLTLLAFDGCRAPDRQLGARLAVAAIDAYQATASRAMPSIGVRCRFAPTCSHYAEAAIRNLGLWRGSAKAVWRIARCGPWTEAGTIEPAPAAAAPATAAAEAHLTSHR